MNKLKSLNERRFGNKFATWLTMIVATLVALTSLVPISLIGTPSGTDKVLHIFAFACLVFPVALVQPRALIWLTPVALLFGGAIEIIQPYFGRGRELFDFFADGLGIIIGIVLATLSRAFVR